MILLKNDVLWALGTCA